MLILRGENRGEKQNTKEGVSKLDMQTSSPLRGTPFINRGGVKMGSNFGKKLQYFLCL